MLGGSGRILPPKVTQAEAEAGTETKLRSWSPLRVDDAIQFQLLKSQSTKVVFIKTMSDFPAASGGVRTLAAGVEYRILENLTTADRFAWPADGFTLITAEAFALISLTYTGTGTFFSGSATGITSFFDMTLVGNVNATLFSQTSSVAFQGRVQFIQTLASGWGSLGSLDSIVFFSSSSAFFDCGGITHTDGVDVRYDESVITNISGDLSSNFITFTGTGVVTAKITGCTFTTNGNEDVLNISSSIGVGSTVTVAASSFLGSGDAFDDASIEQDDIRVISAGNTGLRSSRNIGSFISQGNDVQTVISAVGEGESGYVDLDLGEASGAITAFANNGAGGTTVTIGAHSQPDEKLLQITGTTSYNGIHEIFNATATEFDIDVTFVADDATGNWTTGALADVDIERWELNDASNGELKYIGTEDFFGEAMATISALAVGGAARRFKFRIVVNSVDGFSIPNEIDNTVTETTLRKGVAVVTNDLVKIQVANFDNTSNIIIDTVSLGIQ